MKQDALNNGGREAGRPDVSARPQRFLVVEDDVLNADLFRDVLENMGEVVLARTGTDALSALEGMLPDAILLDIALPDMDGHELLRRIRAMPECERTPVLFVTGRSDPQDQVRGLGGGAVDYLLKPVAPEVLLARIALQLERLEAERRLWRLANCDDLTGLPNRRRFMENFTAQFARARRYGRPLTFLACDIDLFKRINDCYGHDVGDEVLRQFGRMLRITLRDADLSGRVGGEEFAVLLPETATDGAVHVAEKVRQATAALRIDTDGGSVQVTVSIGVAALQGGDTPKSLRKRADEALYASKAGGRDRVTLVPPG